MGNLTIEDKRFLAERLGYKMEIFEIGQVSTSDHFNPDDKHDLFYEIWKSLNPNERLDVERIIVDENPYKPFIFVNTVLGDLPKVVNATLEVLKKNKYAEF